VLFSLNLFADLRLELHKRIKCITFGCPLVGDKHIATWVEKKELYGNFVFLTNHLDLVPKLLVMFEELKATFKAGINFVLDKLAEVIVSNLLQPAETNNATPPPTKTKRNRFRLSFKIIRWSLKDHCYWALPTFSLRWWAGWERWQILRFHHLSRLGSFFSTMPRMIALTVPAFLDVMRLPITAISDLHFRAVICYFCCYCLIMACGCCFVPGIGLLCIFYAILLTSLIGATSKPTRGTSGGIQKIRLRSSWRTSRSAERQKLLVLRILILWNQRFGVLSLNCLNRSYMSFFMITWTTWMPFYLHYVGGW